MELVNILIIAVVFFIASFFGSLAGGGGLITIPTLIFMGLSPHAALGTGKIGGFGNTSGGALGYGIERKIDYRTGFIFMVFAVIGAIFGTLAILSIPAQLIKKLIGVIMIIILAFIFLTPNF